MFNANLYFVIFRIPEAKEAVTAGITLNRPHTYSSGREIRVSRFDFFREKNRMSFNICLRFPRWNDHKREPGLVIVRESKEGVKILGFERCQPKAQFFLIPGHSMIKVSHSN